MSTVANPHSGDLNATFAQVAKHYGITVALCPPRRGNRKGVVEKANHTAAQRWWRSAGTGNRVPRGSPGPSWM